MLARDSLVQAEEPSGLGLLSMRERAMMIGGKFQVRTSPGKRTKVR
jgi:signal transduction histidine kinase